MLPSLFLQGSNKQSAKDDLSTFFFTKKKKCALGFRFAHFWLYLFICFRNHSMINIMFLVIGSPNNFKQIQFKLHFCILQMNCSNKNVTLLEVFFSLLKFNPHVLPPRKKHFESITMVPVSNVQPSLNEAVGLQIFFHHSDICTFMHYFLYEIGLCFAFFHLKCTETF
jgi:hypothetical protein